MSDVEWDAEDFQPQPATVARGDKWEGEDEDADIKDNWDDENIEEDENADKPRENGDLTAIQVKKKKSVKEKIAEKAEQRRKELEERKKQEEEEQARPLSAEEVAAEKLRQQKLQEDADLELAIQAFGVGSADNLKGQIDGMEPSSKEDFDKFEELLRQKITKYEKSTHYVPFLESLFRQLALDLEVEDVKRLGSTLTALSSEKLKQQKSTKGKKSKQKTKLVLGKETDDAFNEGGYDEYDDFM